MAVEGVDGDESGLVLSMRALLGTLLCANLLVVGLAAPSQAEENRSVMTDDATTALQLSGSKLGRGMANLGMGWMEFGKQIYVVGEEEGWLWGLSRGPIDGLGMTLARTVGGIYEILTFPIPIPSQYQPLIHPPYVWQPELPLEER
jgi:putative exosortase-associated protein (TIGR04073 family)